MKRLSILYLKKTLSDLTQLHPTETVRSKTTTVQGVLDLRRHRHTTIRLTSRHPYDTFSSYDATPSRRRFATYWLWSYDCALLNKVSYILKGEGKLNEKFGIDFEE